METEDISEPEDVARTLVQEAMCLRALTARGDVPASLRQASSLLGGVLETAARQREFCETLAAFGSVTADQDGWDAAARHLYQRFLLPGHPAFWSAVLRAVARQAPPTAALLLECAAQSEPDRLAVELVVTGGSANGTPSARTTTLQVAMPIPKSERIAAYNANVKPVFRDLHGGIRECHGESPPDPDTSVYELDVRVRRTANGQQPIREMTQVALDGRYDTVFRQLVVPVLDRLVLSATQQYESSSAASVSQDSARAADDTQTSEIVRGWAAHVFHQHAPPASADPDLQAHGKRVFGDRCCTADAFVDDNGCMRTGAEYWAYEAAKILDRPQSSELSVEAGARR